MEPTTVSNKRGSYVTRKLVLPSVLKARKKKFEKLWSELDEDTKQVIAGSLYVLNHKPIGRPEVIREVKLTFNESHFQILKDLAEYTRSN